MNADLRINAPRLLERLRALGECGARPAGGVSRLALTDADKAGRDLVSRWMREGGYACSIDAIGNLHAVRPGREHGPAVAPHGQRQRIVAHALDGKALEIGPPLEPGILGTNGECQ